MNALRSEVLDPVADARWEAFVDGHPRALVFHHPAWLGLLRDQYGYDIAAWCLTEADGQVSAGLPVAHVRSRLTGSRLVAVPFCDLCGPLAAPEADPSVGEPLAELIAARRATFGLDLEIHDAVEGLPGARPSQRFWRHEVPLTADPAETERRFRKSSIRRGARKGERLGLVVERRQDVEALDRFYALHLATRRHQGVPIQPKRFIRRFAGLFSEGMGFVSLVWDGADAIAAAVFLTFNGTLTYKYGASDREHLAKRPNNLLFLDVIRWGCESGYRTLDLGRTDLDNPGLRDFKLDWGAEERGLSYTLLSSRPAGPPGNGRARRLAATVIRRSPPSVGRFVGEALYRHFA